MNVAYLITPFFAWVIAGITKFLINSLKNKRLAFDLVGYGGMPSNHSAIVSSMVTLIFLREGIDHPAFGVALTLMFIVLLDANSLRKQIEKHAIALNTIQDFKLRQRIGHSKLEIAAGCVVGSLAALVVYFSGF